MLSWIRSHKVLTVAILLTTSISASFASAWRDPLTKAEWRGRWAAYRDTRHNYYRVYRFGMPSVGVISAAPLIKQRYPNAELIVGGCVASREELAYAGGYDEVSEPAAIWHFGHDIFIDAEREGAQVWEANHRKYRSSN